MSNQPAILDKRLYTATASAVGGREGASVRATARSTSRSCRLAPSVAAAPLARTPEQLFHWLLGMLWQRHLAPGSMQKIQTGPVQVTANVAIGPIGQRLGLAVELVVEMPELPREQAEALVHAAHEVCPYSNATRGNIVVDVRLARRTDHCRDGIRLEDQLCFNLYAASRAMTRAYCAIARSDRADVSAVPRDAGTMGARRRDGSRRSATSSIWTPQRQHRAARTAVPTARTGYNRRVAAGRANSTAPAPHAWSAPGPAAKADASRVRPRLDDDLYGCTDVDAAQCASRGSVGGIVSTMRQSTTLDGSRRNSSGCGWASA